MHAHGSSVFFAVAAAWLARREAYFDHLLKNTPPLVYQQEYLAEFVDWSGAAFFAREHLLVNGEPIEMPAREGIRSGSPMTERRPPIAAPTAPYPASLDMGPVWP